MHDTPPHAACRQRVGEARQADYGGDSSEPQFDGHRKRQSQKKQEIHGPAGRAAGLGCYRFPKKRWALRVVQLRRSSHALEGLVTTALRGRVKKVTVVWPFAPVRKLKAKHCFGRSSRARLTSSCSRSFRCITLTEHIDRASPRMACIACCIGCCQWVADRHRLAILKRYSSEPRQNID